ncbi:MAG: hypothetical protein J6C08_04275 [Campylobacter sp.]|uniref:DUF6033 family protein n=1 Tax=Campylobacter sp. TaxID=205 RepID=UPI001B0C9BE8|nr:DUF6033 family protein [Campylobacter sp.]MBO5063707.1 hypothetical protein [Campylobacter sp.]
MIVRIGDTTVSQAAYNYVKSQNNQFSNANELYKELSSKYDSLNFFGASKPNANAGLNNITIAPNILRQMVDDPQKRLEYEALIYDINELAKKDTGRTPNGDKIIASGYMINADGTAGMWIISQSQGDKNEPTLMERLLDELNKRIKSNKERQIQLENSQDLKDNYLLNKSI